MNNRKMENESWIMRYVRGHSQIVFHTVNTVIKEKSLDVSYDSGFVVDPDIHVVGTYYLSLYPCAL